MAIEHNAYYQSPWIETAARNLASALAPADPEKTLAAQRAKWQFEREQELARLQNEMYASHQTGRQSLGNVYLEAMKTGQELPADSPGEGAFNHAQFPNGMQPQIDPTDIKNVLASDLPISDLDTALGPLSPEAREKLGLALTQGGLIDDRLSRTLTSREAVAKAREEGIDHRFDVTDERLKDFAEKQRVFLADQKERDRQTSERNAKIRSTGASGNPKPINITPAQREVLRRSHQRWFRSQNIEPPVPLLDAMTDRSLQYYKEGYNNAPDLARADFIDTDKPMVPAKDNLIMDDVPAQIPLRGGGTLADVLTMLPQIGEPDTPTVAPAATGTAPTAGVQNQSVAPTAASSAAPPQTAWPTVPAPEKTSQLQEGQVTIFSDGEAWGLIGGKPVFIPPDQLKILQEAQGLR